MCKYAGSCQHPAGYHINPLVNQLESRVKQSPASRRDPGQPAKALRSSFSNSDSVLHEREKLIYHHTQHCGTRHGSGRFAPNPHHRCKAAKDHSLISAQVCASNKTVMSSAYATTWTPFGNGIRSRSSKSTSHNIGSRTEPFGQPIVDLFQFTLFPMRSPTLRIAFHTFYNSRTNAVLFRSFIRQALDYALNLPTSQGESHLTQRAQSCRHKKQNGDNPYPC
ncbi:hypothetical protein EVAR_10621_1 [Eumeta japonica]|uniref:Uncharacterized protein n=1 Tax=Eumeta variegata TaxID=151549 RepID=A0A4C1U3E9_EUMVA|nr:hypothetical protein EVAR_10621_1 [Eumeta japonica]